MPEALPGRHPGLPIIELLRQRILELPIPTHPSLGSRVDEEFGLTILDLTLGLRHITRLSEHLTILDRSHIRRSVTIDVDLFSLNERQKHVMSNPVRREVTPDERILEVPEPAWVPVARQSRADLAPVLIRDAGGGVVSRLTHHDTTRYVTAALIHLFHMLLDANPAAQQAQTDLHSLRNRWHNSRWLIESAIASLVDEGALDFDAMQLKFGAHRDYSTIKPVAAPPDSSDLVRRRSISTLEDLLTRDGDSFLGLLDWATQEYPIVVLLPSAPAKCFLSFEAPLVRDRADKKRLWPDSTSFRRALAPNRLFTISYETMLPSSVNSYHLTVEASEEVNVREFLLFTESDRGYVDGLANDLRALREISGATADLLDEAIMNYELTSITARLSDLSRRRKVDLSRYDAHLLQHGKVRSQLRENHNDHVDLFDTSLETAPLPIAALERLRSRFVAASTKNGNPFAAPGLERPAVMEELAGELESLDLAWDVTVDNDPRDNGAHAHWRRPTTELLELTSQSVRAKAYLCLADDPPSLAGSVARMLGSMLGLVYALGWFLSGTPAWVFHPRTPMHVGTADAVVTILLLVPGLLLARLELPRTNTVLGHLRLLSRTIAYVAVILTSLMAAFVAAHVNDTLDPLSMVGVAAGLALLLFYALYSAHMQHSTLNRAAPPFDLLPLWLRRELGIPETGRLPDAQFVAVEGGTDGRDDEQTR